VPCLSRISVDEISSPVIERFDLIVLLPQDPFISSSGQITLLEKFDAVRIFSGLFQKAL
jgi:hypothetical protein